VSCSRSSRSRTVFTKKALHAYFHVDAAQGLPGRSKRFAIAHRSHSVSGSAPRVSARSSRGVVGARGRAQAADVRWGQERGLRPERFPSPSGSAWPRLPLPKQRREPRVAPSFESVFSPVWRLSSPS